MNLTAETSEPSHIYTLICNSGASVAMDANERIRAASQFILQSPPGEINDVLNDVRNIIADDDLLQDGIYPAVRDYNLQQFTVVDIPDTNHQSIISEAGCIVAVDDGEERFLDPRSRISFVFDHLGLEASDPQEVGLLTEHEPFRASLELAVLNYLKAHFPDGVSAVFSPRKGVDHFTIQVVANKYNPTNFWSGRWRSEYTVNLNTRQVTGNIHVNVHYYEQGNVQLASHHTVSFELPQAVTSAAAPVASSKILALIEDEEGKYQISLGESYQEMKQKTFKGLRRALPLTRQKLDWDKVMGYKLGAELAGSKSTHPTGS